jgi:hypothetical protein
MNKTYIAFAIGAVVGAVATYAYIQNLFTFTSPST